MGISNWNGRSILLFAYFIFLSLTYVFCDSLTNMKESGVILTLVFVNLSAIKQTRYRWRLRPCFFILSFTWVVLGSYLLIFLMMIKCFGRLFLEQHNFTILWSLYEMSLWRHFLYKCYLWSRLLLLVEKKSFSFCV